MSEAVRPRFHLAIPVNDLATAEVFYGKVLGFPRGRTTEISIDWDAHDHQVVTHLVTRAPTESHNAVDGRNVPVPHFGLILSVAWFHELVDRLRKANTHFLVEPYLRYEGKPEQQWTMFFRDPSGNALEFKAFVDENAFFGA